MTKFFSPTLRKGREGWGTLVFCGASGNSGSVNPVAPVAFGWDDGASSRMTNFLHPTQAENA